MRCVFEHTWVWDTIGRKVKATHKAQTLAYSGLTGTEDVRWTQRTAQRGQQEGQSLCFPITIEVIPVERECWLVRVGDVKTVWGSMGYCGERERMRREKNKTARKPEYRLRLSSSAVLSRAGWNHEGGHQAEASGMERQKTPPLFINHPSSSENGCIH